MFVETSIFCENKTPLKYSLPRTDICLKDVKAELLPCLIKNYNMKTYGQLDVQPHTFLTPALT